jgi:Zn-finger nucleic acid-binding protein
MQCPNCVTQALMTSQRRDIEIDHCPKCGGVWLDRGELEKIVSLAGEEYGSQDGYGRSGRRGAGDDEGGYQREGRYEEDDDDGGEDREQERYGREGEGESYGSEERRRGERPSIWREIFENLEKLPLPRV